MKRPAVEDFIALTSKPASQWGMADSDVLDLCNYILTLEAEAAETRRLSLELYTATTGPVLRRAG